MYAGISGGTIADVVTGKAPAAAAGANDPSAGATTSIGNAVAVTGQGIGSLPFTGGSADPFSSSAVGTRLDQGQDLTSSSFVAPLPGTIVASDQVNSGWNGGGIVSLALDTPLQLADGTIVKVLYFAEGISPTVSKGSHVNAGQQIGIPVMNPYNGSVGNIEWGPANPSSPTQPLAQVVSNAAGVVDSFYQWARSIGAPVASSTSGAGAS